jgi:hypothetical protein
MVFLWLAPRILCPLYAPDPTFEFVSECAAIMFLLPTSLSTVTGLFATGAVGAIVARVARRRGAPSATVASTGPAGFSSGRVVAAHSGAARRARVGRLRLPRAVVELTPRDEPALAAVNEFADRIADLPLAAWIDAGRSVIADRSSLEPRSTAFAILATTINDRGLAVAAWYARDAIETSAFYASQSATRWNPGDRRAFAAAHAAAEDAALALLARNFQSVADRGVLCAPFESVVREVLVTA